MQQDEDDEKKEMIGKKLKHDSYLCEEFGLHVWREKLYYKGRAKIVN